jgi:hypothetical protein
MYSLYYFLTRNQRVEVYKYTINDLHNNSNKTALQENNTYTNNISAKLYNNDGTNGGNISSVNNHIIKNNVNYVSTITTYKTKYGTVTCNFNYETSPDKHYIYGLTDSVSKNETGEYKGKSVHIYLNGKKNGDRIVTIISENKFLIN